MGRRPARRHHQLPVRNPAVRGVDRGRDRPPAGRRNRDRSQPARAVGGRRRARVVRQRAAVDRPRRAVVTGPSVVRHRVRVPGRTPAVAGGGGRRGDPPCAGHPPPRLGRPRPVLDRRRALRRLLRVGAQPVGLQRRGPRRGRGRGDGEGGGTAPRGGGGAVVVRAVVPAARGGRWVRRPAGAGAGGAGAVGLVAGGGAGGGQRGGQPQKTSATSCRSPWSTVLSSWTASPSGTLTIRSACSATISPNAPSWTASMAATPKRV